MATPAQILANRQNALKSTGPRTEEGKAVSRFNALKTGIHAKSMVIPGEDAAELEKLAAGYHSRFQPADPVERFLVDSMVNAEWQLRRFRKSKRAYGSSLSLGRNPELAKATVKISRSSLGSIAASKPSNALTTAHSASCSASRQHAFWRNPPRSTIRISAHAPKNWLRCANPQPKWQQPPPVGRQRALRNLWTT